MSTLRIDAIEREIRDCNIALYASEGWAPNYLEQPEMFKQLLAVGADMDKAFRDYLRQLSRRVVTYVDWSKYHVDVVAVHASEAKSLDAYDANILVDQENLDDNEGTQIDSIIKEIYIDGIALGFAAQRAKATGVAKPVARTVESPITKSIQEAYDQHIEQLSQWLDKTTAQEIVQSIQESIALGENQDLAMQRLMNVIDDPIRADRIARTEMVRAWNIGELNFAIKAGATQKQWQALAGADSGSSQTPCLDNDGVTVDILDSFPSSDEAPPAHPYCRCSLTYIYANGVTEDFVE